MPIFSLPNELLIQVGKELESVDLDRFIRTSRCLAGLLTPVLHKIAVHTELDQVVGGTVFIWAAGKGHVGLLSSLLDHGCNIEAINSMGWTPLMMAANKGQVAAIQLLLDKGANMTAQDPEEFRETPLHCAAVGAQTEAARVLLEKGAKIDAKAVNGDTPLHSAVVHSHELSSLLLENGANVDAQNNLGETPLLHAARDDDRSDREADNRRIQSDEYGVDGPEEVLEEALRKLSVEAEIRNEAMVRILVERGANVHLMNNHNETPLHFAAGNGYTEMVRILLEKGADIAARDSRGCTALLRAAEGSYRHRYKRNHGHIDVMRLLLENGADIDVEDYEAKTIRQWGSSGNVLFCNLLEEMGQDVEDLRVYQSDLDSCDGSEGEYDGCYMFGFGGCEWTTDEDDGEDEGDDENDDDDEENSWNGDEFD